MNTWYGSSGMGHGHGARTQRSTWQRSMLYICISRTSSALVAVLSYCCFYVSMRFNMFQPGLRWSPMTKPYDFKGLQGSSYRTATRCHSSDEFQANKISLDDLPDFKPEKLECQEIKELRRWVLPRTHLFSIFFMGNYWESCGIWWLSD